MKCNVVQNLLLALTACLALAEEGGEGELNVEILSKPDNCEKTSQKGDQLKMHYTGTLASDGSKFDSR